MGYPSSVAKAYSHAYYGEGSGRIWLEGVSCYGSESRLSLCTNRSWGNHGCSHSQDVGVGCTLISAVSAASSGTSTNIIIIATILPVGIAIIVILFIVGCRRRRARRSGSNAHVTFSGGSQATVQIGAKSTSSSEGSSVRYHRLPQDGTVEMTEIEEPSVVMATREPQHSTTFNTSSPSSQSGSYVLGSKEDLRPLLQPTSSDSLPPLGPINPQ